MEPTATEAVTRADAHKELEKVKHLDEPEVLEDSTDEAKYVISEVAGGRGCRLHRHNGCWRGRGLAFSSYELWDRDPTPNSYTDYCRACWPMEGPVFGAAEVAAESSDDNSEAEDTDDAEDP